MDKKQYVCHISGQGEKWEVFNDPCDPDDIDWQVKSREGNNCHYLPKSEYRLCDPPEVWRDVTETVKLGGKLSCLLYDNLGRSLSISNGYRLRKVQVFNGDGATRSIWAFIVEQQVTE